MHSNSRRQGRHRYLCLGRITHGCPTLSVFKNCNTLTKAITQSRCVLKPKHIKSWNNMTRLTTLNQMSRVLSRRIQTQPKAKRRSGGTWPTWSKRQARNKMTRMHRTRYWRLAKSSNPKPPWLSSGGAQIRKRSVICLSLCLVSQMYRECLIYRLKNVTKLIHIEFTQ